uniref:Uncharacterized protein n=1 Tax=Lepeophtheirus salmonis TaxID=72036 RepID=A0A0K2V967_LEPSM
MYNFIQRYVLESDLQVKNVTSVLRVTYIIKETRKWYLLYRAFSCDVSIIDVGHYGARTTKLYNNKNSLYSLESSELMRVKMRSINKRT